MGHSLGGLLIKEVSTKVDPMIQVVGLVEASAHLNQALLEAYDANSEPNPPARSLLYPCCRGLVFFGVPHLGLRHEKLAALVKGRPNRGLVTSLVVDDDTEPSDYLRQTTRQFASCFADRPIRLVSFFERKLSHTVQVYVVVLTIVKT